VFPLRGKLPAVSRDEGGHGFLDATTDPEQIAQWWLHSPDANVGIRPPAGVVVVDVDPRDGGDVNLVRWLRDHGRELPPTLTVHTGGGGLHAFFRAGLDTTRRRLAELPGVDLKARDTGYVVAPPSVHPETGRRYRWANALPVAEAPRWLVTAMQRLDTPTERCFTGRSRGVRTGRLAGLVRIVLEAPTGQRNDRLNWAAYTGRDLPPGIVERALLDAAIEVGLPRAEAVRTIRSGLAGGRS
jgi:hypothetical protein